MRAARAGDAALVYKSWGDRLFWEFYSGVLSEQFDALVVCLGVVGIHQSVGLS